jgi:hypothetical protein
MEGPNKESDKFIFTFDIDSIIHFVIINYKQIILLCFVFVIIYIVDLITFHNSIIYGVTTGLPIPTTNLKTKKQKNKK